MTTHASQKEPNNYSDSSIPQDTHNLKSYTNADAEKNESENVVQSNIIDNEDAVRKEPVDSLWHRKGGGGGEQIEFHDLDNTKFMQECCI